MFGHQSVPATYLLNFGLNDVVSTFLAHTIQQTTTIRDNESNRFYIDKMPHESTVDHFLCILCALYLDEREDTYLQRDLQLSSFFLLSPSTLLLTKAIKCIKAICKSNPFGPQTFFTIQQDFIIFREQIPTPCPHIIISLLATHTFEFSQTFDNIIALLTIVQRRRIWESETKTMNPSMITHPSAYGMTTDEKTTLNLLLVRFSVQSQFLVALLAFFGFLLSSDENTFTDFLINKGILQLVGNVLTFATISNNIVKRKTTTEEPLFQQFMETHLAGLEYVRFQELQHLVPVGMPYFLPTREQIAEDRDTFINTDKSSFYHHFRTEVDQAINPVVVECLFILSNISGGTQEQTQLVLTHTIESEQGTSDLFFKVLNKVYEASPRPIQHEIAIILRNIACGSSEQKQELINSLIFLPMIIETVNEHRSVQSSDKILLEIIVLLLEEFSQIPVPETPHQVLTPEYFCWIQFITVVQTHPFEEYLERAQLQPKLGLGPLAKRLGRLWNFVNQNIAPQFLRNLSSSDGLD
ncbi:hypothetical protein BLNAU_11599 [Blattamonas nauphoetae]|uniref:Dymeclin n=1 Tax=Blattamonas nauphoetae TaxID=2049346 RepID=A0ABQ9XPN7_9EUKA|nr:hypothetical protein BLNAU_11599 [Blattamonas nauphoetae]